MNTWEFNAITGAGSEIVTVVYEYEEDSDGTYGEAIREIWYEGRNVIGLFADEQFRELEMEADMRFQHHKLNFKQESDIQP